VLARHAWASRPTLAGDHASGLAAMVGAVK
jgi:hypothetical protein